MYIVQTCCILTLTMASTNQPQVLLYLAQNEVPICKPRDKNKNILFKLWKILFIDDTLGDKSNALLRTCSEHKSAGAWFSP